MSGRVCSAIFESGMVRNVGVAVGITSPALSVQKLFQLPVSWQTFWVVDVGRYRKASAVP